MLKNKTAAILALALISTSALSAQSVSSEAKDPPTDQTAQDTSSQDTSSQDPAASVPPGSRTKPSAPTGSAIDPYQQPNRILGFIPNFRAVSANTTLPPLSVGGKWWLATRTNFDYSSVLLVGIGAGISQANDSNPEFGQGAAGFGRRFWHSYADSIIGNYFTIAILPSLTNRDPRYYTLGHGGVLHRTGYSLSRLFIQKNDAGRWTANFSEIPGNLFAASISNAYYPASLRGWVKTYQRWGVQVGADAAGNLLKEFWPDIASMFSKNKNNNKLQGRNHP